MRTNVVPVALAIAIHAMRADGTNLADCRIALENVLDFLDTSKGIRELAALLNNGPDNNVPMFTVRASDVLVLALMCMAILHKDGRNLASAIDDIRFSTTGCPLPMVRATAQLTLLVLGDREAQGDCAAIMHAWGIRSIDEYEQTVIPKIISYLVNGPTDH